jgi:hypothetical protein
MGCGASASYDVPILAETVESRLKKARESFMVAEEYEKLTLAKTMLAREDCSESDIPWEKASLFAMECELRMAEEGVARARDNLMNAEMAANHENVSVNASTQV